MKIKRKVDAYGYVTYNTKKTYIGKEFAGQEIDYPLSPVAKGKLEKADRDRLLELQHYGIFKSKHDTADKGKGNQGIKDLMNRIKSIQPTTLVHWFCKIASDHELSPRETQDFSYLVAEHVLSNSPDSELKEITSFLISRLKNTTAIYDHSPRASFWRSLCLLVRGYRVHIFEAREYIPHPSRYNTSRRLENANSRVLECLQLLLQSHQPNQDRKS